ncbi:hypothetical protein DBZ36_19775 [Alginatibacterium sediminis]|uniref:Solute-binding protein family 3/N-terminal domain-containing protein n=1 Tax=Alginatibacterium sediminis TaxID=2164068 RepID=A0A420E624_9ALTE|nr:hypothetical protein [Alginatibacterium sediminis]RKF13299.1 hypothetical protein DBZ36_19775 [Alginatibacterium sediminis]
MRRFWFECRRFLVCLCLLSLPVSSFAQQNLQINLPEYVDDSHLFYHELIQSALVAQGHSVEIGTPGQSLPQKRAFSMLQRGQLSAMWVMPSQARDNDDSIVRIDFDLTQGLLGKRVLLIAPDQADRFANIENLAQFRQQAGTAAFGVGWLDAAVWHANQLQYREIDGEWRRIYRILLNRHGIDYFSRGLTEVLAEQERYPFLLVEPRLLLVYPADFQLYVSKKHQQLIPILDAALRRAQESGLQQRLIDKYWADDLRELKLDERLRIPLAMPPK